MAQFTTFVFTDLVGSVDLKGRMPGADAHARDAAYIDRVLRPHRQRIEEGLAEAQGRVVSTAGDGHFLVFPNTARAALWAIDVVRAHEEGTAGSDQFGGVSMRVRIGMHAGEPQPDPSDPDNFIGRAVDYAARLADHAQGGQILLSRTTAALVEDGGLHGVRIHTHGAHDLKGIGSVELFELIHHGREPATPRRAPGDAAPRDWSVLPRTMGLTEYSAQLDRGSTTSVVTAKPPRRVGNYELGELLGAGGMGNVYKASHAQFNRPRAVKIIRPDLMDSGGDSVVRRFYQEVRATGSLEHPNLVVAIDSSSPDDEEHFLVMEYIDGVSLDKLLRAEGALPVADACEIARQAALGLEHLYEQNLVHRDVKPSNLMLTLTTTPHLPIDPSGSIAGRSAAAKAPVVKLMDLGLALLASGEGERVTQLDRGGMGTGHYMSPEQWRTTSVDIRADIYSLGCTLHHLLMGEPPFARSDLKPERAHAAEPPAPLRVATGVPPALVRLVDQMLAKAPRDRPQTPLEVAEALEPLAAGNELAERIKRFQGAGSTRRIKLDDTRGEPADSVETNRPADKPLVGPAPKANPYRWVGTGVATVVALLAIFALMGVRSAMLQRHRDDLRRTASLAADALAEGIEARLYQLADLAENSDLREWLREIEESSGYNPDSAAINRLQGWLVKERDRFDERYRSSSWFVTDANGVQLARSPSKPTIGKPFLHRDYFHGRGPEFHTGAQFKAFTDDPEPISQPHQSEVYRSSKSGDLKVAFSTPIFGSGGDVVGVLAMSVVLGEFEELARLDQSADEVEILLVDTGTDMVEKAPRRGLVLHHRDLTPVKRLPAAMLEHITANSSISSAEMLGPYDDVLGRDKRYWGAVARIAPDDLPDARTGMWVVIAQEPAP